ncbi:MAG: hypothetical protein NVSMB2_24670 [Chloroflexota bacterium]
MVIGLIYASVALACGVTAQRVFRLDLSLAPLSGLACVAVVSSWCAILGAPPFVASGLVLLATLCGIALAGRALRQDGGRVWRTCRAPTLVLAGAVLLPLVLLGIPFAGLETPVSTHDGAFHVETIDALRRGAFSSTWYPVGFHATVASILGWFPWLDSARGTYEVAEGLAVLAPVAVFCFSRAIWGKALAAGLAAVTLGLTWTYPYDYHLWSGWPQGMGVLLLIGLWSVSARWITQPSVALACLAGICAGAIVLSHGTEVYGGVLGLAVLGVVGWRRIKLSALMRDGALAVVVTLVLVAPYVLTLLGWARAGGATSVGASVAESVASAGASERPDAVQFLLGIFGAASLLDLPARVVLLGLGLRMPPLRSVAALWLSVAVLLFVVDFVSAPLVTSMFALTYPWLADERPRQLAVVCGSVLAGGGLWQLVGQVAGLRRRWMGRRGLWRRLTIALVLIGLFFAEGSGVSVFKRVSSAVAEQNVVSADDVAAYRWLRANVLPGELVANDGFRDAGIWVPFKAGKPIVVTRIGSTDTEARHAVVRAVPDLSTADPDVRTAACQLHVRYIFRSASPKDWDPPLLPDLQTLRASSELAEVFTRPDTAVFRINTPCP